LIKVIESPKKEKFITDIKIDLNEFENKNVGKIQPTIQNIQNIVDEDLLEIERKHSSDVYFDILKEKFKFFYNSYLVNEKKKKFSLCIFSIRMILVKPSAMKMTTI